MYWDSGYTPSPHIEALLKKEDVTLKELLDDDEILQEYKSQNKALAQFFNRTEIIEELVALIVTEPPEDVANSIRFKHSNVACEILTTDSPALTERLVERQYILQRLYAFLEQDPPLNPLLTSFFSKTFGMLITKKNEQDWFSYQCVCLQVLEFIKTRKGFLDSIYKHIGTPVIMDLLFQIITNVEGSDMKNDLLEWLNKEDLVHRLISILGNDMESDKHNNIAQFISDIITTGRTCRQNEIQKRGNVEFTSDASDILIKTLEDEKTTNSLLDIILLNSQSDSSIVSGIKIILKLLENPIINEPVSDTALQFLIDAEEDHHRKVVNNILRIIAPRIKDFHELLINPAPKPDIQTTITLLSPPFGNTRLQMCTLFAVLLEKNNADIIKSICETDFFNTLLKLFKQYCWNNILHNQVKRCIKYSFEAFDRIEGSSNVTLSALQTHIIVNCKIVSKLIDCWMHNNYETHSSNKKGCRLGYMGHLIEIFDSLVSSILLSDQFRALIESNIDEQELQNWNIITDPLGQLENELQIQRTFLAGIDPAQSNNYAYDNSLQKDCQDTYSTEYINDMQSNRNHLDDFGTDGYQSRSVIDDLTNDSFQADLFEEACNSRAYNPFNIDGDANAMWDVVTEPNDLADHLQNNLKLTYPSEIHSVPPLNSNPWEVQNNMNAVNETGWATFSLDTFADFDKFFDQFTNNKTPPESINDNTKNVNINELGQANECDIQKIIDTNMSKDKNAFMVEQSDDNANIQNVDFSKESETLNLDNSIDAKHMDAQLWHDNILATTNYAPTPIEHNLCEDENCRTSNDAINSLPSKM